MENGWYRKTSQRGLYKKMHRPMKRKKQTINEKFHKICHENLLDFPQKIH